MANLEIIPRVNKLPDGGSLPWYYVTYEGMDITGQLYSRELADRALGIAERLISHRYIRGSVSMEMLLAKLRLPILEELSKLASLAVKEED